MILDTIYETIYGILVIVPPILWAVMGISMISIIWNICLSNMERKERIGIRSTMSDASIERLAALHHKMKRMEAERARDNFDREI